MALINCPDCGTEVSDAAPVCPKCGRPIALGTSPTNARYRRERSRSPATFTITLSSFVLIVLAIAAAVWFVPSLGIGQNLMVSCQVSGTGEGKCQFTNTGWTPGAQCVDVSLRNQQGGEIRSGPICSGRVWPNDTTEKNVMMVIGHTCDGSLGLPDLSQVCTMDVRNVDSNDADGGTPMPPTAPQPDAVAVADAAAGDADQPSAPAAATDMATGPDQEQTAVPASSIASAASEAVSPLAASPNSVVLPADNASVPAILQAVIAKTTGPSFDCSKATSATALVICGNADLSGLDRQMAIEYYSRTKYATDEAVRNAQRAWIRARNTCQTDIACVRQAYSQRIQQLQR